MCPHATRLPGRGGFLFCHLAARNTPMTTKPQVPSIWAISPPSRVGGTDLIGSTPSQVDRDLVGAVMAMAGYRGHIFSLGYGGFLLASLGCALAVDSLNTPWEPVGRVLALAVAVLGIAFTGLMQRLWRDQTLATLNGLERRLNLPETKSHREVAP